MSDGKNDSPIRHARGSSGQPPEAGLARDFSELARELRAEESTESILQRIVETAVSEIDAATDAGVSEISGDDVHTQAATSDLVRRVDALQYEAADGPCLTALRERTTVRSDDLAGDPRWPKFGAAAAEAGVHSMLAVQLFVEGDNLGALNLYAAATGAFDDADESTAMMLASHAAVAMKGGQLETHLRTAIDNRDVIGQAKGIMMERYKINADEAFHLLVEASQRTNVKLSAISDRLATTGELYTG